MKRTMILIAVLVALTVPMSAGWAMLEQITVAGSSIGFTAANINQGNGHPQANYATCRVRTAQVSVRWDGGTPTSTVGILVEVGDLIRLDAPWKIVNFRAIRTTSTSGQLDCLYSED